MIIDILAITSFLWSFLLYLVVLGVILPYSHKRKYGSLLSFVLFLFFVKISVEFYLSFVRTAYLSNIFLLFFDCLLPLFIVFVATKIRRKLSHPNLPYLFLVGLFLISFLTFSKHIYIFGIFYYSLRIILSFVGVYLVLDYFSGGLNE
jgi:hypothetical protein